MGQSAIPAALVARDFEAMRAAMVGELMPVIPANVDPQTWDPREKGVEGGNTWQAVIWQERIWYRDEESLVDHDEITCIRLLDGVAYLTNDVEFEESVLTRELDTPPEDPEIGQQWLVPEGAIGEWATRENEIAKWTARGYRYKPGSRGLLLYVEDERGYIHFNVDDEWEEGTGFYSLPDGSIRPNNLLIRGWQFENQTATSPPATGPAGETYIAGPGSTGAWAGKDKRIFSRPAVDAAFVEYIPFIGEEGYDKNLAIRVTWDGSNWISAAGSIVGTDYVYTAAAAGTFSGTSGVYYSYSPTTPPTTTQSGYDDPATIVYAASAAGVPLKFRYDADIVAVTASSPFIATVGLFRNTETNAIAYRQVVISQILAGEPISVEFNHVTAIDDEENTYKVRVLAVGGATGITSFARRDFSVYEETA